MVSWKRNLVFVWLSQFLSIMGFAFAMPFAAFYIQELGVTDPLKLKLWVALFSAAAPLSLAIFSPIWGVVADRYGRRLMLLRANLGASVFLVLMGTVNSVAMLVLMRTLQGVLTGTMTAAQTMVASHAPRHRSGFALGALSSAVFSGAMAGASLGGLFADAFGFRNAFFVASGLLVLASLMVIFGTDEKFQRPERAPGEPRGPGSAAAKLARFLPLLIPIGICSLLRRFDNAYLPLLVQDIHGSMSGSPTRLGGLFAMASVAGLLAGFTFGHLADRVRPHILAFGCALCGGLLLIPHGLVRSLAPLFMLRFASAFALAGMEPVLQALLARTTPHSDRGFTFGWAATVRAVGWGLAPLASGAVASTLGTRAVFFAGGSLLIAFAAILAGLVRRSQPH